MAMSGYKLSLQQKVMFFAVLSSIFLAALDQTIVSTALPIIAKELHAFSDLPWIVVAYLWTSTASLPVYGKLGDIFGRKKILMVAVFLFLLGSILSGLSWNLWSIIAFRALQGLGGGGIMVSSVASISDFIPLEQRGKYQGLVGAAFGLATLIGPLLGGFLVQEVSWRSIFYINVPFGIMALYVIHKGFPQKERKAENFDWKGALTIFLLVSSLVFLLEFYQNIMVAACLATVFIGSFLFFLWNSAKQVHPILPLHFFLHRTFLGSVLISFFVGIALLGTLSFLPTYYQDVRGMTPTDSGFQMLFLLFGMMLSSVVSGMLITKYQKFKMLPVMGTILIAVGLFVASFLSQHTPFFEIDIVLSMIGIGLGATMQVTILSTQWSVSHQHLGIATSTVTLFRSFGGTLAVTGFGAIFTQFIDSAKGASDVQHMIIAALHWNFLLASGLVCIAFLASFLLEELHVLKERRP